MSKSFDYGPLNLLNNLRKAASRVGEVTHQVCRAYEADDGQGVVAANGALVVSMRELVEASDAVGKESVEHEAHRG